MKEPTQLNPVANAVEAMAQTQGKTEVRPDPNMLLLQAQAELRVLRYCAQETQAQRDRANTEAAEFGARCRLANEEKKALHAALKGLEGELVAERAAHEATKVAMAADLARALDGPPVHLPGSTVAGEQDAQPSLN